MSKPRALVVVSTALVSSPESIAQIKESLSQYEVHQQLAQRLDERAVSLNANQYDLVQVAGTQNELVKMNQHSFEALYTSLRVNGSLEGSIDPACRPFVVIAGFVHDEQENKWTKPAATLSVPLSRKRQTAGSTRKLAFKRNTPTENAPTPQAIPSLADLGLQTPGDDDIIDEDDLVDDDFDSLPALKLPAKCDPGPGRKRRKACKDCTCGLKEMEEQEADRQRAQQANVVSLSADDLAEIDFTVPGKAVGGCGSCALGDAFRCDGCPYLGLPPFKPGEVVTLDGFGDDF